MGWGVVLLALPAFLAVISSIFTQNKGAPGAVPKSATAYFTDCQMMNM